eukprot:COSAG02_NODE_269_length_26468_cov_4.489021_19_plen_182_part_00
MSVMPAAWSTFSTQTWPMNTRLVYLWCYLVLEGLGATLVFAGLLPAMLEVGAKAGEFSTRFSESKCQAVCSPYRRCHTGHDDESATNLISTVFGAFGNLGGIVGPAIGAPLLSQGGFRLAIATWGVVALLSSVILGCAVCLTDRCCPLAKQPEARYSAVSKNDEEEACSATNRSRPQAASP